MNADIIAPIKNLIQLFYWILLFGPASPCSQSPESENLNSISTLERLKTRNRLESALRTKPRMAGNYVSLIL